MAEPSVQGRIHSVFCQGFPDQCAGSHTPIRTDSGIDRHKKARSAGGINLTGSRKVTLEDAKIA